MPPAAGAAVHDDAARIDSWGPGQELEVERCFAPLLQWVRSWWVPTGGRELAQEPLVQAVDPTAKQDDLVALVISVVYGPARHSRCLAHRACAGAVSPGLTISAAC